VPWHEGISCEKAIAINETEWAANLAGCPKCKSKIEKTKGCQHMTCTICRYEWCWVCGMPYKSIIHYALLSGVMCEFIGLCHFKLKGFKSYFVLFLITICLPLIVFFFSSLFVGVGIFMLSDKITCKKISMKTFCSTTNIDCKPKILFIPVRVIVRILLLIAFLLLISMLVVLSVAFGIALCGLILLPVYVFHVYSIFRLKCKCYQ
jgi:hypothetical protein